MASSRLIYNTLGEVVMSDIDIERLKWDADYWDEVGAAEGTTHYCPVAELFYDDNYPIAPCCIPRPTKQEWEGGLPTVDCECEFIHPGIRSHGWQTGVIKAYFDDRVVIQSNPLIWEPNGIAVILIDSELKFRPLKSKAERQWEELAALCDGYIKRDDYGHNLADAILSRYNLEPKP